MRRVTGEHLPSQEISSSDRYRIATSNCLDSSHCGIFIDSLNRVTTTSLLATTQSPNYTFAWRIGFNQDNLVSFEIHFSCYIAAFSFELEPSKARWCNIAARKFLDGTLSAVSISVLCQSMKNESDHSC